MIDDYSRKWGPSNYCADWTGHSEYERCNRSILFLYGNGVIDLPTFRNAKDKLNSLERQELQEHTIGENDEQTGED